MAQRKTFYGWTLVGAFFAIYSMNAAFPFAGASVINAYMAEALKMDRSVLGLGFTVSGICVGLISPLVALFINKKGIRFTLFSGALIIISGALLMATAVTQGWQYILVFGLVVGVGVAFGGMIPIQTGVTFWFAKKRALAMSIVLSSAGIGAFIAAPVVDKIIIAYDSNWKAAWFFIAGVSALAAVLILMFVKNKPADIGQVPDGISEEETSLDSEDADNPTVNRVYRSSEDWKVADAFKTASLWLILLGAISYAAPFTAFLAHSVIHLRDISDVPQTAAMSVGLVLLFSIVGRLLAGAIGDRIEPRYIWAVALWIMLAGSVILVKATNANLIYLYSVLVGIGYGSAYVCMVTLIGNYYGANSFASIMGIFFPMMSITSGLAPFVAGLVFDRQGSYAAAFYGMAVLTLIGALLISFAKPPKPS